MLVKSEIKYIQSLGQKKHRDEHGVFIAEGPKIVEELLEIAPSSFLSIYASPEWISSHEHLTNQLKVTAVDEIELGRISQLQTPNGVVAILKKWEEDGLPASKGKLTIVLDTIQDPGNLGTIIRTADWFGVSQIVCSPDSADCYSPKVVQSTMGSIARVKVIYTDLAIWLDTQQGVSVFGAVLDGENLKNIKPLKEGILVIGNESKGISDVLLQKIDRKITIPGKGKAESLNAAVATGIILNMLWYE